MNARFKAILLTATAISLTAGLTPQAWADDEAEEVQALKKEVKALEARINQMEAREKKRQQAAAQQTVPAPAATTTTTQAYAPAAAPANASLAQRVTVLERNQEVQKEEAAAVAGTAPSINVGPNGLVIASPDKQYSINLHGYVQADDRTFLNGGTHNGLTDTFLLRSARPIIDAKMTDYFDTHFMMDFGKGQSTLLDAYGNIHPLPDSNWLNFRAGETKVPVGLERWQSEQDVEFVERGQTTNLVPYRDIGVMAYGFPIADQLEYELGVMNGAADLQVNTGAADQTKDVVGRIFTHPLMWSGVEPLEGFGLGIGGTYGNHQGTAASPDLTAGYATIGQRTWFAYSANTFADGPQWRINPQMNYYYRTFGLYGEYVLNDQEVAHGTTPANTTTAKLRNDAWEGAVSYVLTGEDAAFDGVKPAHNFDPKSNQWGAFELVGRLSELSVDKRAFPTFASFATSSSNALERTVGVNWYFNQAVKLNLDFSLTSFDNGITGNLDHPDEKAIMSRVQLKF